VKASGDDPDDRVRLAVADRTTADGDSLTRSTAVKLDADTVKEDDPDTEGLTDGEELGDEEALPEGLAEEEAV
jgi:hypothetical protein